MPPRHRIGLGPKHRASVLRSLVSALFTHESIATTLPKARAAQIQAEKAITVVKHAYDRLDRQHARALDEAAASGSSVRSIRSHNVLDQGANRAKSWLVPTGEHVDFARLVRIIAPRYRGRPGGYTRIYKTGHRQGDHAPSAVLELVDGPHDLSFFLTAMAVGRALAMRTGGCDPWLVDGMPDFSLLDRNLEPERHEQRTVRDAEAILDEREGSTESASEAEAMDPPVAPSGEQATAGQPADTLSADALRSAGARWPVLGSTVRSLLDDRLLARVDKVCRYRSAPSLLFFEATAHYHFRRALADPRRAVDDAERPALLSGLGQWSEADYVPANSDRARPASARLADGARDWRGAGAQAV